MAEPEKITLRLFRYDPSSDEAPRYDVYTVPYKKRMRVLDALDYVYDELEQGFAYRWYCGVKKCGDCGISVNGRSMLACWEPAVADMTCEPLTNFPIVRDLVVDASSYERVILDLVPFVQRSKHPRFPEKIGHAEMEAANKLSSCIECNVCSGEVPVKALGIRGIDWDGYAGPAALVRFARFVLDPRDETARANLGERWGLKDFPLYASLRGVCPQGLDIVHDALVPSRRKLYGPGDEHESTIQSTRVFIMAREWSAFVRLTDAQKDGLMERGAIKPRTIPGIPQAFSLEN
jgi:succinate dehydrogenase/fumarate reductase iron-sulfur protein